MRALKSGESNPIGSLPGRDAIRRVAVPPRYEAASHAIGIELAACGDFDLRIGSNERMGCGSSGFALNSVRRNGRRN